MICERNGLDGELRALEREALADPIAYIRLAAAYSRNGNREAAKRALRLYRDSGPRFTPETYEEFITITNGVDTVFQPLPDFARYSVGKTSATYAEEVYRVRRDVSAVYQPCATILDENGKHKTVKRLFTFEENIRARLDHFNTLTDDQGKPRTREQRLALFIQPFSSCTGAAYKANSTKLKIDPMCRQLIEIREGFNQRFLEIPYESADGIELDATDDIYNQRLTEAQARKHKGWKVLIQDDSLRENFITIAYSVIPESERGEKLGMSFWIVKNQDKDQLRTLVLHNHGYSGAGADWDLGSSACSLRVAQK